MPRLFLVWPFRFLFCACWIHHLPDKPFQLVYLVRVRFDVISKSSYWRWMAIIIVEGCWVSGLYRWLIRSDKGFRDLREPLEIARICIFYEGIKRALLMYLEGAGRRPKISVILWRIHIHTSRVISTLWGPPRRKSACTNCSSLRLDPQITRARHRFEVKTYFHNTSRHTHTQTGKLGLVRAECWRFFRSLSSTTSIYAPLKCTSKIHCRLSNVEITVFSNDGPN